MRRLTIAIVFAIGFATGGIAYGQVDGTIEVQCQNPSGNGLTGEGVFRFFNGTRFLGRVSFDCSGSEVFTLPVLLPEAPTRISMINTLNFLVDGRWRTVRCPSYQFSRRGVIHKSRAECWANGFESLPFAGDCTKFTYSQD